jgi:hypothetical protein
MQEAKPDAGNRMSFGLPKAPPMKTKQENYPKCRTCRHWKQFQTLPCDRQIQYAKEHLSEEYMAEIEGLAYVVHPDVFGCTLHESITTSSQ